MHGVTTTHEDDGIGRGEKIQTTNRTISIERLFVTNMFLLIFERDARIATVAMVIVKADALTNATDLTLGTMIDRLSWSVIVKLADGTKV